MAELWGRRWSREELEARTGDLSQIAGVRLFELSDGRERGVRTARLYTGSGFAFTVLIDRGLDISQAEWCGRSLSWTSMTGDVHPAYFDPRGLGWVRSFYGGLLVTCGLHWAGAPVLDTKSKPERLGARELGLHGNISHTPAKQISTGAAWDGDEYRIWIEGQAQDSTVFGENLILHRRIETCLGASSLTLIDRVENAAFEPVEHMQLYHINIGFPALDAGAELMAPSLSVEARDEDAAAGLEDCGRFEAPHPGFAEQAFFHRLGADQEGGSCTAIVNRDLEFGAYARFNRRQLPCFTEWKMTGARNYVVGMEPANCLPLGRVAEREAGRLVTLAPRETVEYRLELGALTSAREIDLLQAEIRRLRDAERPADG